MPESHKLTQKQSGFAQSVVDGKNQSDAYRLNYACENMTNKQIWEESSKLAANPKVAQWIASLRQAVTDIVVANVAWDRERLIEALETNLNAARENGQLAAANGALRLIAKAAGLLDAQPQAAVQQVTKVTVVLNTGVQGPENAPALEADYR